MGGTVAGGKRAAKTNKKKYGADFYARIGKKGGIAGHTGGFASTKVDENGMTGPQRAALAGAIGGHNSKRGPAKATTKKVAKEEPKKHPILAWFRRPNASK